MIDQKRLWDSTYKWMGDHKIIVSIYEVKSIGYFKVNMSQDLGNRTVNAHVLIRDTEWYEIELNAFRFRALMMSLYNRLGDAE